MIRKKLITASCILFASLSLTACTTNTTLNTTTETKESVTEENMSKDNVSNEYETEDVRITNPDEALKRLKEGNDRFVNNESKPVNISSERREQLKEGQHPYAVVVSCSDSRVTPTTVFNAGLGEIFDIRIAGNVVDDDALGSIEYGVEHTGAPLVVVMGHESCGAVTAAYDEVHNNAHAEGNIEDLVEKILPSVKGAKDIDEAIHNNIDNVAKEIKDDDMIKDLVKENKVKIVKAYYSLDGKVTFMD